MSKSNPSTQAFPKGRGVVLEISSGPNASHKKVANAAAVTSLSRCELFGVAPPIDRRIFLPIL